MEPIGILWWHLQKILKKELDKMHTVFYPKNQELADMATQGLAVQVSSEKRRGRPRKQAVVPITKGASEMADQNEGTAQTAVETKQIQKTVFDLKVFANILLVKDVEMPRKPETVSEALVMVGNDQSALMDIIYKGLVSRASDEAQKDMSGFKVLGEDGEPGEEYSGNFADGDKKDLINAAILSLAKMQGYEKSLSPEKKRALKEKAADFLRSNPAMLASIQS